MRKSTARNVTSDKNHLKMKQRRKVAKVHPWPTMPREQDSPKDLLLKAGRHLFAVKGLSGTSIRDIAKEAGVNSSQISYYFENKIGLYRECLLDIAKERVTNWQQILTPPHTKDEFRSRLKSFCENLFQYFVDNRESGLIIVRESDRMNSPASDVFLSFFSQLYKTLDAFFSAAQQNGFIKNSTDPLTLAHLLLGSLMSELRLDHIKNVLYSRSLKSTTERNRTIDHLVSLFASS